MLNTLIENLRAKNFAKEAVALIVAPVCARLWGYLFEGNKITLNKQLNIIQYVKAQYIYF